MHKKKSHTFLLTLVSHGVWAVAKLTGFDSNAVPKTQTISKRSYKRHALSMNWSMKRYICTWLRFIVHRSHLQQVPHNKRIKLLKGSSLFRLVFTLLFLKWMGFSSVKAYGFLWVCFFFLLSFIFLIIVLFVLAAVICCYQKWTKKGKETSSL